MRMNTSQFSIRSGSAAVTAAALMLLAQQALGQALDIRPQIDARLEYNDNPRMQLQDEDDSFGTILDARLPMTWATQRTELIFNPRAVIHWYSDSDDDDLERTDWYLNGTALRRFTKSEIGLNAGYREVGVLSSELEEAVPEDPDIDDPGTGTGDGLLPIRVDETREQWDVSPYWTYQMDQSNSWTVEASYTDTTFDKADITGRADWDGTSVSGQWDHILNPRDTISVQATAYAYESNGQLSGLSDFNNETDNLGLNVTYSRQWSETVTVSLLAGLAYSDIEGTETGICEIDPLLDCVQFDDDDTNWLANLRIRRRAELTTLNFDLGRRVVPSSGGTVVTREEIALFVDRRLSERFTGTVGVRGYTQDSVGDVQRNDRDYFTGELRARYRLSPRWSVVGGYRYIWQEFNSFDTAADTDSASNRVYIGVTFQGYGIR